MPTALLSLADAKAHLNITGSSVAGDAEVQLMVDAAAKVIESRVGLVDGGTFTKRFPANSGSTVVLPHTGAITITAITPDVGPVWSLTGVTVDPATGIVTSTGGLPSGSYGITYTVAAVTPASRPNLVLACKIIVQHMWETRRGPSARPAQGGTEALPGVGYLIPYRAEALLAPDSLPLGFA